MWDAIEELEPSVDADSYQGNLLLVFLDEDSNCDADLHAITERRFAEAPGGRDLQFSFAFSLAHKAHHKRFRIRELPAAVFVRDGVEMERCASAEDVLDLVDEIIAKYT